MDRLTYIGHATALLRLDGVSILTDPMLRGWLGPLQAAGTGAGLPGAAAIADLVLISHLHRDHLDLPFAAARPLDVPRWWFRGTPPGGWRRAGAENIHEIGVGETVSVGDVEITGGAGRSMTAIGTATGARRSRRSAI